MIHRRKPFSKSRHETGKLLIQIDKSIPDSSSTTLEKSLIRLLGLEDFPTAAPPGRTRAPTNRPPRGLLTTQVNEPLTAPLRKRKICPADAGERFQSASRNKEATFLRHSPEVSRWVAKWAASPA